MVCSVKNMLVWLWCLCSAVLHAKSVCVKTNMTELALLYKHQWNTRWAFARKHDIFTGEITCYLHMWKYHRCHLRLSHQKSIKVIWFDISLVFIWSIKHYLAAWRYGISLVLKYFLTLEEKFRISARPCNILYKFTVPSTLNVDLFV